MSPSKKNLSSSEEAPKSEGLVIEAPTDVEQLSRLGNLEQNVDLLWKKVEFVTSSNSFILVVLFLGFLALLVTLIGSVVQAWLSDRSSQVEVIKSINQLDNDLNSHQSNTAPVVSPPTLIK